MNNILKNVCSAQKLHGAEHAGSMEQREMEERNSRYRCLKMKAAAAWALAVLLSLLSVFGGEVSYVNEIQMSLAALVLLFPGNAFYAAARKQLCVRAHRAGYADCLRRFRCFPFQSVQHVLPGLIGSGWGFTRMSTTKWRCWL